MAWVVLARNLTLHNTSVHDHRERFLSPNDPCPQLPETLSPFPPLHLSPYLSRSDLCLWGGICLSCLSLCFRPRRVESGEGEGKEGGKGVYGMGGIGKRANGPNHSVPIFPTLPFHALPRSASFFPPLLYQIGRAHV